MSRGIFWSLVSLVAITVVSIVVGFVLLPSAHADFSAQGVWDMICRAAGVPEKWSGGSARPAVRSTSVVLDASMAAPGPAESGGRGASLVLAQCTMCHGPQGMTDTNAPNLAGQYPDVVAKQLVDYKRGDRTSAIMQALASHLSDQDVRDIATYYASLPKPRNVPVTDMSHVPALVKTGDPIRNIAPCAACHGGIDRKLGTPWLEGMPADYLKAQLAAFASGERRNDSHRQMRNVAGAMNKREIEEVAEFFARPPATP